jgi:hypothetical protein
MNSETVGSNGKCEPGKYHLQVNSCEECTSKGGKDGFKVEVEVLDGTVEGQVGRKIKSFLYPPVLWDFVVAIGLENKVTGRPVTLDELNDMRDPKQKKPPIDAEFVAAEAVSCQFFAAVVPELDDDKKVKPDGFPRLGFFICSVVDERAKDIPRNQAMIDMLLNPTGDAAEVDRLLT